jgi:NADPH:quinone reductase-like Zn-dependent oxidoreductase
MAREMMRAAVRYRYGPPDVVELRDVERPEPAGDQILVRVHAASVNRADLDSIRPHPGFLRLFTGPRAPWNKRVGSDVAGVVEATGPDATRFRRGDRVFADLFSHGMGAFAEYACATERAFAAMPQGASFEDAATLPHSAILALQGLRRRDGRSIRAGDRVLIVGASGNVGPFAVQIAKLMGAEVTGVCRTEKVDFVRSLGADHVIDYTQVDVTATRKRYDWILEPDSHHSMLAMRRLLARGGSYVSLGGDLGALLSGLVVGPLVSLFSDRWSGLMLWWKPFDPEDVVYLSDLLVTGQLRPAIDRRLPLSEVVEGLRHVDEGHAQGKVIIQP